MRASVLLFEFELTASHMICCFVERMKADANNPPMTAFFGRGDDTVGNPHRAQIVQFELCELILLLKFDNKFSIEQFEPTVSQSTVSSPLLLFSWGFIIVHMCIYIYIYTHAYICIYIYTYNMSILCVYRGVYLCVCMYIYIYI